MTDARPPSLLDRVAARLRREAAWPADYWPTFAVLAAVPGATALLATALAIGEARQEAAMRRAGADRIAASETMQRTVERRREMAPYLAAPTVSAALDAIVALLPADAVLHAIERRSDGGVRIEVDCPDPDALLRTFRPQGWRSAAQAMVEGSGIRVTLDAGR